MWIADGKIMDAEKAFYSKANCNTLIPDEVGLDGGSHCVDHRCEGTDRRSPGTSTSRSTEATESTSPTRT